MTARSPSSTSQSGSATYGAVKKEGDLFDIKLKFPVPVNDSFKRGMGPVEVECKKRDEKGSRLNANEKCRNLNKVKFQSFTKKTDHLIIFGV